MIEFTDDIIKDVEKIIETYNEYEDNVNEELELSYEKKSEYIEIYISQRGFLRSIWCFVDKKGFMYKPIGWNEVGSVSGRVSLVDEKFMNARWKFKVK